MNSSTQATTLGSLARMVVKDGVGLGGLSDANRGLALACVWACLPQKVLTEAQVNDHLRMALAGAACWLGTDHVELRRWLVDMGWVVRDGYGRAYERVALSALAPALQPLAQALVGLDINAWVAQARHQHQAAKVARRQAWSKAV